MNRDYSRLSALAQCAGDPADRMRAVADGLWNEFQHQGVSWVGFYLPDESNPEALMLGPSRNKPACSPIGMHGACGRSFRSRRAVVVRDVRRVGDAYIACDPRDLSEVVIPCLTTDDTCWGVLDVDSFSADAFDESDVAGLLGVLRAAGLVSDAPVVIDTI